MALNGKYVTVERILEKVYSDYGFSEDLRWSDAIEWIGDGIDLVGVPMTYIDKIECISISGFKGALPNDFLSLQGRAGVRDYESKTTMTEMTDTFYQHNQYGYLNNPDDPIITNTQSDWTYKLNNNYIWCSFRDGKVEMAYKAFPTDERGLPLIPDDTKFITAIVLHVADKFATRLYIMDKLSKDKKDFISRERDFYFGSAYAQAHTKTLDEMEALKNMLKRVIPKFNEHQDGFKNLTNMESLRTHNYK